MGEPEPKVHRFTTIGQFRDVVRKVRRDHDVVRNAAGTVVQIHTTPYPILEFVGTVKLHGSNGAIVKRSDGTHTIQSRRVVLTPEQDNYGFAAAMARVPLDRFFDDYKFDSYAAVYGEWCGKTVKVGGSAGVHECEPMFVVFAAKVDGRYVDVPALSDALGAHRVYDIREFGTYSIVIDFNEPEAASPELHRLTEKVEADCPAARFFGFPGRVGEGIVWRHGSHFFKVKGAKHSVTKVTTLAPANPVKFAAVRSFVEYAATANRFQQGRAELVGAGVEPSPQTTGEFIRWVMTDIKKEESDVLEESKLAYKDVGKAVAAKARAWWLLHL